jgi:hypothetical protein
VADHIIRPNEPEFNYSALFPGNLLPPPADGLVTAEAIRTTLNLYRDNFERQRKFDRQFNQALEAADKWIKLLKNCVVFLGIAWLVTLGIALFK